MSHSKKSFQEKLRLMIQALRSGSLGVPTITLKKHTMPIADAVKLFESYLALYTEESTLLRALDAKREQVALAEPAIDRTVSLFDTAVRAILGKDSEDLSLFGIKVPKKPEPPTLEEKTLRAARARATRALRGTLGKRQKAALKADAVDRVVVVRDEVGGAKSHATAEPTATTPTVPATPASGTPGTVRHTA